MSQTELQGLSGFSQGTLSKLEAGIKAPDQEQAQKLATVLGVYPEFFGRTDYVVGAGIGEIYHRKRSIGAKKLAKIHARMNILRMVVCGLLDSVEGPPVSIPVFEREQAIPEDKIEELAMALRHKWYVPDGPIASVSQLLGRSGILLVPFDFDGEPIDAIGLWLPGETPLIFFNPSAPDDRLRFTLMHEVAHFCLHTDLSLEPLTKAIESEADRFASAFLMPAEQIRGSLVGLSIAKLGSYKLKWKCSMASLIHRAKDLGTISPRTADEFWRQMSTYGYRTQEPQQYDIHCEEPSRKFDQLIALHKEKLGYSNAELAKLGSIKGDWAYALLRIPNQPKLSVVRR